MTITPEVSVAIAFVIFVVLVAWKGTKKNYSWIRSTS